MAIDLTNVRADISKLEATDLRLIQNEVLSAIAGRDRKSTRLNSSHG